jgi:dCMP deaminase
MDRPNWIEYFREISQVASKRSSCHRLKVGCVLVKDNHIISMGYNGTVIPGIPNDISIMRNDHEQATIHAEQNAILDCAKRGVSCDNSVAFITHFPCLICYRLLCGAGIKKINYINDYKNDDIVYKLMEITQVMIEKI